MTRDQRIEAAMLEAGRHARAQLKREGLTLPVGTWEPVATPAKGKRRG